MYRAIVLGELGYISRNCGQLQGASKSTFKCQSESTGWEKGKKCDLVAQDHKQNVCTSFLCVALQWAFWLICGYFFFLSEKSLTMITVFEIKFDVSSWNVRIEIGQSRIPTPCFLSCGNAAAVELHAVWQKGFKYRIRLGEQRGSFSPLRFFSPAYKMTAETAVRCWYKREGQQEAVISCGGNLLQQQCHLTWNSDFIGFTRYHPRNFVRRWTPQFVIFLLNHKHFQHIIVISHFCTNFWLAFGSNSFHSTMSFAVKFCAVCIALVLMSDCSVVRSLCVGVQCSGSLAVPLRATEGCSQICLKILICKGVWGTQLFGAVWNA